MSAEDYLEFVKDLENYHKKELSSEARLYFAEGLAKHNKGDVRDAICRWRDVTSPSQRFPSLKDIRLHVDEARLKQWKATKEAETKFDPNAVRPCDQDPKYYMACWDLVKRAKGMTKDELVWAFRDFDEKHPGNGWAEAAGGLKHGKGESTGRGRDSYPVRPGE
jgi:hypothetical protein